MCTDVPRDFWNSHLSLMRYILLWLYPCSRGQRMPYSEQFLREEPREKLIQGALNLDRFLRVFLILKRIITNNYDIVFAYFLPGSICSRSAGSFLCETRVLFGWYLSILCHLKCTKLNRMKEFLVFFIGNSPFRDNKGLSSIFKANTLPIRFRIKFSFNK